MPDYNVELLPTDPGYMQTVRVPISDVTQTLDWNATLQTHQILTMNAWITMSSYCPQILDTMQTVRVPISM